MSSKRPGSIAGVRATGAEGSGGGIGSPAQRVKKPKVNAFVYPTIYLNYTALQF